MLDRLKRLGFQVAAHHHAGAILQLEMTEALSNIESVLENIRIPVIELIKGGGGEGELTQRMRTAFSKQYNWTKHSFRIRKIIDDVEREAITHVVDHFKVFEAGNFALEIEWNNKDPFFDRDLENFKRLHADGAISIGCIITRGESLQDSFKVIIEKYAIEHRVDSIEKLSNYYTPTTRQVEMIEVAANRLGSFARGWAHAFVNDKYGEATTRWRKLDERIRRGVGSPCPLLLIGIPAGVVTLE